MQAIFEIDANRRTPKYLQIVHSVTKAIKAGHFKKGDRLFSINELSNEFLLSRDTVQKAYEILEKDRIIAAVKGKGFYIARTDVTQHYNVLLVFNKLSSYKRMIYESFVAELGHKGHVDLKIHHSSLRLFKDIMRTGLGEYDYYVIMPHFYGDEEEALELIKQIPTDQLILMDKAVDVPAGHAAVYQDFENDIADVLESEVALLKKYNRLLMVHPRCSYPLEIIKGFNKFCQRNSFPHGNMEAIAEHHPVEKGEAYVVIEETDLANLIKRCKTVGLRIGTDVGIISYNDTPLKEILLDGITVISTDHHRMGETAARFILDQKTELVRNPFRFIARNSL